MQIQINNDRHIDSSEARDQWARSVVEAALGHLADHVTRVDVHLSDESAGQGGAPDKRCLMETRPTGRPPIAVTQHAPTIEGAVSGAVHKLTRAMEHDLGRAAKHTHDPRATPADDADEVAPAVAPN